MNEKKEENYELLYKCLVHELKEALLECNKLQLEKLVEEVYVIKNKNKSIIGHLRTLYNCYYHDADRPSRDEEDEINMILEGDESV